MTSRGPFRLASPHLLRGSVLGLRFLGDRHLHPDVLDHGRRAFFDQLIELDLLLGVRLPVPFCDQLPILSWNFSFNSSCLVTFLEVAFFLARISWMAGFCW